MRYVTQEEWRQIDAAEVAAGKERGKPRVKIIEKEAMLAVLEA